MNNRIQPGHFWNVFAAVATFSTCLFVRRRRMWLMAALMIVPLPLPFLASALVPYATLMGQRLLVAQVEYLYLFTLVPLTALFFAGTLFSEEVEGHTFPLLLSRPAPRSAIVLGKFTAYFCVTFALLAVVVTIFFTIGVFALHVSKPLIVFGMLPRYLAIVALALLSYGALCLFVSTISTRPVIVSAIFLFGWEKAVVAIPGYADFLTFEKYLRRLAPDVPFKRLELGKLELPVELLRTVYPVGAWTSLLVLLAVTVLLLALACVAVRKRQYAAHGDGT